MKLGYLLVASFLATGAPTHAAEPAEPASPPTASSPTPVADPIAHTPETDIQCFLVLSKLANSRPNAKAGKQPDPSVAYYHGRASAQFPPDELKAAIIAETLTLRTHNFVNLLTHCTVFAVEQQNIMKTISQELKNAQPIDIIQAFAQRAKKNAENTEAEAGSTEAEK